jgi:hypothetical protein
MEVIPWPSTRRRSAPGRLSSGHLSSGHLHNATRLSDSELLAAYRATRERSVRDELVERFMPFARKMALRYNYTHESLDDLGQVVPDF